MTVIAGAAMTLVLSGGAHAQDPIARLNEKLRTVASTLAETGEFDAGRRPRT